MQLLGRIRAIASEIQDIDVDMLSGVDAKELLGSLVPLRNCLDAFVSAVAARAVVTNQHHLDGARSAASWFGSMAGISEKAARRELVTQKQLNDLPDMQDRLRAGEISIEKASLIGRAADGDVSVAQELLSDADQSVEFLQRRVQEIRASSSTAERRERLRKSQFVNLQVDEDSMVSFHGHFLAGNAVGIVEASNITRRQFMGTR